MKFVVSYFFAGCDEQEGVQMDIVEFKDKKSCIESYNTDEYEKVEIEEYDENAILEDMYSEEDDDLNEYDQEKDDDDRDQESLSMLFPNADTEEELEEELEHSFSRMMDN